MQHRGIICPECHRPAVVHYTRQGDDMTERTYRCDHCPTVRIDTEESVICVRHLDGSGVVPAYRERTLFDFVLPQP